MRAPRPGAGASAGRLPGAGGGLGMIATCFLALVFSQFSFGTHMGEDGSDITVSLEKQSSLAQHLGGGGGVGVGWGWGGAPGVELGSFVLTVLALQ